MATNGSGTAWPSGAVPLGQDHLIAQFQGHQSYWAARGDLSHWVRPERRHIRSLHPQDSHTHPTDFSMAASCPLLSHSHPMCSPPPRKPSFHWIFPPSERQNFTTGRYGHRAWVKREKTQNKGKWREVRGPA